MMFFSSLNYLLCCDLHNILCLQMPFSSSANAIVLLFVVPAKHAAKETEEREERIQKEKQICGVLTLCEM